MTSRTARVHLTENLPNAVLWNPIDWRRWRLNEARKAELTNWPKHDWAAVPQLNNSPIPMPPFADELHVVDEPVSATEHGINLNDHADINLDPLINKYTEIGFNVSKDEVKKIPVSHAILGIPRRIQPNSDDVQISTFAGSVSSSVEVSDPLQIKLRYANEPTNELSKNVVKPIVAHVAHLQEDDGLDANERIHLPPVNDHENMQSAESHNNLQFNRISSSQSRNGNGHKGNGHKGNGNGHKGNGNGYKGNGNGNKGNGNGYKGNGNGPKEAETFHDFSVRDSKVSPPSHPKDALSPPCESVVHLVHNDLMTSMHAEAILKPRQDELYRQDHLNIQRSMANPDTASRSSVVFGDHHDHWTTQRVLYPEHPGMIHTETLSGDLFMKTGPTSAKHIEHFIIGVLSLALVAFIVCQMAQQYRRRRRRSRADGGQGKNTSCFLRLRRWMGPFSKRRNFNCSLPTSAIHHPPQLPGRPVRVETPGVAAPEILGVAREEVIRVGGAGAGSSVALVSKGELDHGALTVEMRRRPGLAYNPLPPLSVYAGVQSSSSDYPGSSASRQSSYSGGENSLTNSRPLGEGLVSRQLRSKSLAPSVFLVDARGPYAAGHSTSPFWRTYQPSSFTTSSSAPISSTPSSSSSSASDCDFRIRYAKNNSHAKVQQRIELATGFSTQPRASASAKWISGAESDTTNNLQKDETTKQKPPLRDIVRETFNIDALRSDLNEKPSFASDTGTSSGSSFGQAGSSPESKNPLKTSPPEYLSNRPAVKPRTRKAASKMSPSNQNIEDDKSDKLKAQKAIYGNSQPIFHGILDVSDNTLRHSRINPETVPMDVFESSVKDQTSNKLYDGQMMHSDEAESYAGVLPKNKVNTAGASFGDASSIITIQKQQSGIHKLSIDVSTVAALLRSARHPDVSRVDAHSAAFHTSELADKYEQNKREVISQSTVKSRDHSQEKDSDSSLTNVSSLRASFTTSS